MPKHSKTSGNVMIGLLVFLSTMFWSLGAEPGLRDELIVKPEIPKPTAEASPVVFPVEIPVENPNSAVDLNPKTLNSDSNFYNVTKVVDGDTIAVSIDGKATTIRMIGVDTPETVDPRKPVQCFGLEASNKTKTALSGQSVRLEYDPSQGKLDKYGRLLAYVFLSDGTNWNEKLIREGYAHEYTYALPYKYQASFKASEKFARENAMGLWVPGVCDNFSQAASPAGTTPLPIVPNGSYVCDHDAYNCGNFATHTEAQSVYEACGGVMRDVHELDGDHDGLACESLPD